MNFLFGEKSLNWCEICIYLNEVVSWPSWWTIKRTGNLNKFVSLLARPIFFVSNQRGGWVGGGGDGGWGGIQMKSDWFLGAGYDHLRRNNELEQGPGELITAFRSRFNQLFVSAGGKEGGGGGVWFFFVPATGQRVIFCLLQSGTTLGAEKKN